MATLNIKKTTKDWNALSKTVFVPHSEEEYNRLVVLLDELIDEVGEDESHPLASLMEIIGILVEHYEDENVPEINSGD